MDVSMNLDTPPSHITHWRCTLNYQLENVDQIDLNTSNEIVTNWSEYNIHLDMKQRRSPERAWARASWGYPLLYVYEVNS